MVTLRRSTEAISETITVIVGFYGVYLAIQPILEYTLHPMSTQAILFASRAVSPFPHHFSSSFYISCICCDLIGSSHSQDIWNISIDVGDSASFRDTIRSIGFLSSALFCSRISCDSIGSRVSGVI